MALPNNFALLHGGEEELRQKAVEIVSSDDNLLLHLTMVEKAMDIGDLLRQYKTTEEDLKVIQILGMRTFNAFAASLKLTLSGYHQNGALILRDILETAFLLDLFRSDHAGITRWRTADKKERLREFRPVKVREALDKRDGFTKEKRRDHYALFSELAGHPTMKSALMLRPEKTGDAVIGPFMEETTLRAVISETGQLAVQVGGHLLTFFPSDWSESQDARTSFNLVRSHWIDTFCGDAAR